MIEEELVEPSRILQRGAGETSDELREHDVASLGQPVHVTVGFRGARRYRYASGHGEFLSIRGRNQGKPLR